MEDGNAAPAAASGSSATPQEGETTVPGDLPLLRLDWQQFPAHGRESTKFSVEIHHGGNFVGSGQRISYLDEKSTVWFDNLDRNSFNYETLFYMINRLGYEQRLYIFWCPPGNTLDALKEIVMEKHCKVFGVESHGRNYVVELNLRSCTCRRWQLTGIPCSHSIACMRHERIMPESMVSSCYSMATYMQAYGGQVFPLRDNDEWAPVHATPILPPLYEKSAGRRKKNRRKQPEESQDGTRLSKHGVLMHCGYCKSAGHNRASCSDLKAAILREINAPEALDLGQQPSVQQEHH